MGPVKSDIGGNISVRWSFFYEAAVYGFSVSINVYAAEETDQYHFLYFLSFLFFLQRLETRYLSSQSEFNYLYRIVRSEIESKKAKSSSSCANALLWLTRSALTSYFIWKNQCSLCQKCAISYVSCLGQYMFDFCRAMDFLSELFGNLMVHPDWSMSQVCADSYGKSLKKWHGWLASSSFSVNTRASMFLIFDTLFYWHTEWHAFFFFYYISKCISTLELLEKEISSENVLYFVLNFLETIELQQILMHCKFHHWFSLLLKSNQLECRLPWSWLRIGRNLWV